MYGSNIADETKGKKGKTGNIIPYKLSTFQIYLRVLKLIL